MVRFSRVGFDEDSLSDRQEAIARNVECAHIEEVRVKGTIGSDASDARNFQHCMYIISSNSVKMLY